MHAHIITERYLRLFSSRHPKRFIDLVTRNNNAALGFNILSMNQVVLVESNVQVSISISQDIALLVLENQFVVTRHHRHDVTIVADLSIASHQHSAAFLVHQGKVDAVSSWDGTLEVQAQDVVERLGFIVVVLGEEVVDAAVRRNGKLAFNERDDLGLRVSSLSSFRAGGLDGISGASGLDGGFGISHNDIQIHVFARSNGSGFQVAVSQILLGGFGLQSQTVGGVQGTIASSMPEASTENGQASHEGHDEVELLVLHS